MSTKKIKIKKNLLKETKKALKFLEKFQNKNNNGSVFLFEEDGKKETTFQSLLESEQPIDEIVQIWEKSACHQLDEMAAVDFVIGKANDALIMLYIQGKDLIVSALSKAAGAVKTVLGPVIKIMGKIWGAIKRFCSSHPIICKVIAIALMVLVIFLVVSLLGSEAQAKITVGGGEPLNDTQVSLLKGFVQDLGGHGPVDSAVAGKLGNIAQAVGVDVPDAGGEGVSKLAVETVNWIDRAHRSTEVVDITTVQESGGKIANEAFSFIKRLWSGGDASDGMKNLFMKWIDAGKDLIGTFEQTIERTASTLRQSTKVGWDAIPSDPETGQRILDPVFKTVQQNLNEELKRMKELAGIV